MGQAEPTQATERSPATQRLARDRPDIRSRVRDVDAVLCRSGPTGLPTVSATPGVLPVNAIHHLPASPASARLARTLVRGALAGCSEADIELAELLVSELVTNALLHAGRSLSPTLSDQC